MLSYHCDARVKVGDNLRARPPTWIEAKRHDSTLASIVEQGLGPVAVIPNGQAMYPPVTLPECWAGGGIYAGVDLNDIAALLDRMSNPD
jgi:hypothetical protein